MSLLQILIIVWVSCFLLLIPYAYFNRETVTVGQLVLSIVFAPIVFIACYGDWDTIVIDFNRRDKR